MSQIFSECPCYCTSAIFEYHLLNRSASFTKFSPDYNFGRMNLFFFRHTQITRRFRIERILMSRLLDPYTCSKRFILIHPHTPGYQAQKRLALTLRSAYAPQVYRIRTDHGNLILDQAGNPHNSISLWRNPSEKIWGNTHILRWDQQSIQGSYRSVWANGRLISGSAHHLKWYLTLSETSKSRIELQIHHWNGAQML